MKRLFCLLIALMLTLACAAIAEDLSLIHI